MQHIYWFTLLQAGKRREGVVRQEVWQKNQGGVEVCAGGNE